MQTIGLTKGYVALVDDGDFDDLSKFKWIAQVTRQHNVYASRTYYTDGKYHMVGMHQHIMGTYGIKCARVDHKNFDTLDNQRHNLRVCTPSQNCGNRRKQKNTSSKYKGVSWDTNRGYWRAHVHIGGKRVQLGRFSSEEDAAKAYNDAALEAFGEFALLNTHQLGQTNNTHGRIDPFDPDGTLGQTNHFIRQSIKHHRETVWLLEDLGFTKKQISAQLGISVQAAYQLSYKREVAR